MNSVTIIGPTRWASTKAGGDQNGANLRSASYSPNLLNQYSSRTVPRAFDVTGVGFATNSVTVNGLMTYRKGEYFQKELGLGSSAAWWTNIQVQAGGSTTSGYVFTPATPEMFQYDQDGNLTNDGRWSYWWDGENRLTNMIASTTKGPQLNIRFEYDWQGRRIAKKVWSNIAASGNPILDEKYVYDGWNLIAILNPDLSPRTSFVWGTDLSGSIQGAGGVGGLLAVYDRANGVHFTTFDGNGNVAALVSAATGEPSAQYEYGPFGEVIRATGPMAKANPFRFSTKYQDDETDLLYYGYRYYSASTGRWLGRDPFEEHGSRNLYGFVRNAPTSRIDTDGRVDIEAPVICPTCGRSINSLSGECGCQSSPPPEDAFDYPWWVDTIDVVCDVASGTSIIVDIATIPSGEGALATAGLQACKYKCKKHVKEKINCRMLYEAMKKACGMPHSCNEPNQSSAYYATKLAAAIACEGARATYQKKCWKPKSDPRWEGHIQKIAEEARAVKKCSEQLANALAREGGR